MSSTICSSILKLEFGLLLMMSSTLLRGKVQDNPEFVMPGWRDRQSRGCVVAASRVFGRLRAPWQRPRPGARGVLSTVKEAVHGIDIERVMRCKYSRCLVRQHREGIAACYRRVKATQRDVFLEIWGRCHPVLAPAV